MKREESGVFFSVARTCNNMARTHTTELCTRIWVALWWLCLSLGRSKLKSVSSLDRVGYVASNWEGAVFLLVLFINIAELNTCMIMRRESCYLIRYGA